MRINIGEHIRAIDMHVHLADEYALSFKKQRAQQMAKHFGTSQEAVPVADLAAMYREQNMMAVLVNSTDYSVTGNPAMPNDYVAQAVADHPDVFIGFGIVDPRSGKAAEREAQRCQEQLGLVGIGEFNPARQHFMPHDPEFHSLWSVLADCGLIALFHGGYAAAGSGTKGGLGVKLRYARPIYLDDVAADHPDLRIICAHPSWPWGSEALAVAQHKKNVYLDLSGWAPKYFSDELKQYMRTRIPGKVLFGSDWPGISAERWLREFEDLGLSEELQTQILLGNARKLLQGDTGLSGDK